jgi:hypothetical protein
VVAPKKGKQTIETLGHLLFRDRVQFCSGLVDLVVGVGRHLGGGHRFAMAGERFVGRVAEDCLLNAHAPWAFDFPAIVNVLCSDARGSRRVGLMVEPLRVVGVGRHVHGNTFSASRRGNLGCFGEIDFVDPLIPPNNACARVADVRCGEVWSAISVALGYPATRSTAKTSTNRRSPQRSALHPASIWPSIYHSAWPRSTLNG